MTDSKNRFEAIERLIEDAADIVDFGKGISAEWIVRAELRLGFQLPTTYKWWLLEYGGGELYGDEIYSLYDMDDDHKTFYTGDILSNYERDVGRDPSTIDKLTVFSVTDGDSYYFDLSQPTDGLEYSICSHQDPNSVYANDFLEFLEKQILTTEL